jgi:hypothetical protein
MTATARNRPAAPPDFWDLARQAAFVTESPQHTYEWLKREWQRRNFDASQADYDEAINRIAEICRF